MSPRCALSDSLWFNLGAQLPAFLLCLPLLALMLAVPVGTAIAALGFAGALGLWLAGEPPEEMTPRQRILLVVMLLCGVAAMVPLLFAAVAVVIYRPVTGLLAWPVLGPLVGAVVAIHRLVADSGRATRPIPTTEASPPRFPFQLIVPIRRPTHRVVRSTPPGPFFGL